MLFVLIHFSIGHFFKRPFTWNFITPAMKKFHFGVHWKLSQRLHAQTEMKSCGGSYFMSVILTAMRFHVGGKINM